MQNANPTPNPKTYEERILATEKQFGRKAAIERGTNMICSWMLGRDFGEPVDQFFARNPRLAEFRVWFNAYREQTAELTGGQQ